MKTILLASAMILAATGAMAQSVTSPSGVVLADDLARPDTWRFHERERSCDPNMWQEPVGHNVWMNVTCERLANSSLQSRRDRAAAREAAEKAREEAANQPPVDDAPLPVVDEPAPMPTPNDDETVAEAPPAADKPKCNASGNNRRGGNDGAGGKPRCTSKNNRG